MVLLNGYNMTSVKQFVPTVFKIIFAFLQSVLKVEYFNLNPFLGKNKKA